MMLQTKLCYCNYKSLTYINCISLSADIRCFKFPQNQTGINPIIETKKGTCIDEKYCF